MSKELLERIRKQREFPVTVGKFKFTVRRPTAAEANDLARRGALYKEIAGDYVVNWEGVTENDVVGGGGSDVPKFSIELWREWCSDRQDFWDPIAEAALDAYVAHKKSLGDAGKNSEPG